MAHKGGLEITVKLTILAPECVFITASTIEFLVMYFHRHFTDGPMLDSTVNWFGAAVSKHYILSNNLKCSIFDLQSFLSFLKFLSYALCSVMNHYGTTGR